MINRRITMAKKKAVNDSDRYAGLVQPGTSLATEFMETGNIGLDMAISDGRGMPIGGVVTFFAGPGCGKSTTCVDVSKRLLKKWHEAGLPYKILYIDIEKSNDLMNNMGLSEYIDDGTFLLHPNLCTFQTLQNYCDDILAGNGPMENVRLIIIDSLQNLICGRELENGIETGDFGDAVRYRNRFYKAYLPQLKARGISCLFVSQQRKKQALINPRENPNKSALTDGDKHYADTLLYFTKTTGGNNAETKKKKYRMASSNEDVGISDCFIVTMKIDGDKNRYGSRGEVKTLCKYGVGSDNWWILHNILKQWNHLKNKGSASTPNWAISDELNEYTNSTFPSPCNKAALRDWIRNNMTFIKDFLRSWDEYHNLPQNVGENDSEGYEDADDDE